MYSLTRMYRPLLCERKTVTGFGVVSYSLLGPYTGFIQPLSGHGQWQEGKHGEKATHRLYTATSTALLYEDKVTQNGQSYKVLYALQPSGVSGTGHHKEIIMELFQ